MADYTVDINDLESLLASLANNTPTTPYEICVNGLSDDKLTHMGDSLGVILDKSEKFVIIEFGTSTTEITTLFRTFEYCRELIGVKNIPNSVTNMERCFEECTNFNQPITIPNSVTNMSYCFRYCTSFNQPITIPNSVTNMSYCFAYCETFNQPITIPNSVTNMSYCFAYCETFNQPLTIPNSVTNMDSCFSVCTNFNQPITIPNSVTNMYALFWRCNSLNKNVYIDCRGLADDNYNYSYLFVETFALEEVTLRFNSYEKAQKFLDTPQCYYPFGGGSGLSTVNIILPKNGIQSDYHGYHLKHINNDLSIDIYNKQGELIRNTTIPYSQNLTIVGKTNELVFGEEIPSEKIVQAIDSRTPFSKTGTSGKYDITKKNFILWGEDPNAFLTNLNFDTTVRDFIVPVGFIYTQYPLELPPWQLWTFTTQSNWENISNHFAGLFSRIEGGNSEQFEKILPCSTNGTTLTFETTTHGITNFSLLIDTTTWECRQVTAVNGASVTITEAFTDSVNLRNVLIGEREQLPNVRGKFRAVGVAGTESGAFRYDSSYSAYSRGSGSDLNNKKMSLSLGQTNADGTTYISELQSVYKDGGIVRPNAYITRVWKRVN